METKPITPVWSTLPVPPGVILAEELAERGMSQKELSKRTGRPVQVINEIIRGKKRITHETALELERVLGIPGHVWTNLESIYQMTIARNEERSQLERQVEWLKRFPVRELVRRRWIPSCDDRVDTVRALLKFLGVAMFDNAWNEGAVGFRITGGRRISEEALAVWLRKGQIDSSQIVTEPYDESRFMKALDNIRELTVGRPEKFLPEMKRLCAGAGVAFVLTQEFPKSGANGAARWVTSEKALIQMSIRWKWADIFWFTFFHEACHILRHELKISYVEGKDLNEGDKAVEAEADEFARDLLIRPSDWTEFILGGDWSRQSVEQFARKARIDPGIVVGRMQHERIVPFNQLAGLKTLFTWVDRATDN